MIVRDAPDGSLILIGQTDHAKLSGQCAAHWGNKIFARPRPYEAVVRAAMFHDSGWYDYEASPSVAAETGRPLNFLQVTWGKPQRHAFEWAIDWMTQIDSYSGLLVGKHRTGLQRGRYGKVDHPKFFNASNLPVDNEDFLARNEEAQAKALRNYDEAEFWTNYLLLQAFDLISLFICNLGGGRPTETEDFQNVPARSGCRGASRARIPRDQRQASGHSVTGRIADGKASPFDAGP